MRGFCKQYWILWKLFIFVSTYVGLWVKSGSAGCGSDSG